MNRTAGVHEYRLPEREDVDAWSLPRGPHGLQPAAVAASQRARLLYATVAAVAARGYPDTTIGDIVRIARVSRKTFYEQFDGRESCFLTAYRAAHYGLVRTVIDSQRSGGDWHERVRDSVRAYLGYFRDRPEMSRALLVEIHAVGKNAWDYRNWGHERFARMQRSLYELRRSERPELPELPAELFRAATAGIEEMVAMRVREGRAAELMNLEAQLRLYIHALYDGCGAAPPSGPGKVH